MIKKTLLKIAYIINKKYGVILDLDNCFYLKYSTYNPKYNPNTKWRAISIDLTCKFENTNILKITAREM